MNNYKDKKVAVIGFGVEGKDVVDYMLRSGAKVTVYDKRPKEELNLDGIKIDKIDLVCGPGYLRDGLDGFDFIVRSPGVYPYTFEIAQAKRLGVIITSATKIFFDECPAKIIGVTGTKGKGTTSTLIYELLKAGGYDVYLAGNIGKPMLELLSVVDENSYVILEMSSFQLIDMEISPHIAVVLNITEDHMDWHKDREEYVNAKMNIVSHQTSSDFALINEEYETPKSFAEVATGKLIYFSKQKLEEKFKKDLLLRGEHNLENIAAAVAVAKCLKIPEKTIINTVKSFKGLEHRLELVGTFDGITFYNDSFATGPQPTIAAINSFTEDETLILGGSDKGLDYSELRNVIEKKDNVKNLILIGDIGEKIGGGISGKNIINLGKSPMDQIVKKAFEITPNGGVVILSPSAASFDMFKNYKERGSQFKEAVSNLKK